MKGKPFKDGFGEFGFSDYRREKRDPQPRSNIVALVRSQAEMDEAAEECGMRIVHVLAIDEAIKVPQWLDCLVTRDPQRMESILTDKQYSILKKE